MSEFLASLMRVPGVDLSVLVLSVAALLGWLLGVAVALFFTLTRRVRMIGSPPWWAILAFGLATAAMLSRQYLNGAMAAPGEGGKLAGYGVVGALCILYALRRGRQVGFRLFGEYGWGGDAAVRFADTHKIPRGRLLLHLVFWGVVAWTLGQMFPHASGHHLLLLVVLLFAGLFPFARRISLLEWSQKSEVESDRSRGNRFLLGAGMLLALGMIGHPLISPNHSAYVLAGLSCLLIGFDYRGTGLQRLFSAAAPAPRQDDFPVFQPVEAPTRRPPTTGEIEPIVSQPAVNATVGLSREKVTYSLPRSGLPRSGVTAWPGSRWQAPREDELRQPATQAEPAGSGFRPLYLLIGFGLLAYAAHLWREYLAHDGYGGIVILILAVFNIVLTLAGVLVFFSGFPRTQNADINNHRCD
jgi:hypothetical protein